MLLGSKIQVLGQSFRLNRLQLVFEMLAEGGNFTSIRDNTEQQLFAMSRQSRSWLEAEL